MKILMVCLGNICRSPLAEGILKHRAKAKGINCTVDSAGTAAYHVGELPDPRSIDVAKEHGIDITDQSARKFTVADFDNFDQIFVMDKSNLRNVLSLARNHEDKTKVKLILDYHPDTLTEVPDPYYGDDDGFENVYNMLLTACDAYLETYEA